MKVLAILCVVVLAANSVGGFGLRVSGVPPRPPKATGGALQADDGPAPVSHRTVNEQHRRTGPAKIISKSGAKTEEQFLKEIGESSLGKGAHYLGAPDPVFGHGARPKNAKFSIFFDNDADQEKPNEADAMLHELKTNTEKHFFLISYASKPGSTDHNMGLSKRRGARILSEIKRVIGDDSAKARVITAENVEAIAPECDHSEADVGIIACGENSVPSDVLYGEHSKARRVDVYVLDAGLGKLEGASEGTQKETKVGNKPPPLKKNTGDQTEGEGPVDQVSTEGKGPVKK